jgi:hypothetical protein
MPLEAWQPVRTVVAGCVWVRVGAAEPNSVSVLMQTGISCGWLLALLDRLDEAESFFISHLRQQTGPADPAVPIWKFLTRCRFAGCIRPPT